MKIHACLPLPLLVLALSRLLVAADPPITAVAFAPDGKSLVAVSQAGVQVLSWPDLKHQRSIKAAAANLHCVRFSPAGKQIAVGGGNPTEDGGVELFAWPSGKPAGKLAGHADSVRSLAWLDNGRLMTAGVDHEIRLWNLAKPAAAARVYRGHSRGVDAICLLPDAVTLVSAGVDQSVRVWDVPAGKLVRNMSQHTGPIHALALRPGDEGLPMVASAAADRTIRFWQPTIGRLVRYIRLDSEPLQIVWLGDGSRILAACRDGQLRLVNADEVKVTQTLPVVQGWAYAVAVHPTDGSCAVAGSGGQVRRLVLAK